MVSQSLVSTREKAADKLAIQGALLVPSAIPCSLSRLIFRIHSFLFSEWRRTTSSKFFDTQVPSISTEELVLLRHARCVFSHLHCNGHSLLPSSYFFNWQNREFDMQRMRNLSQDTSQVILHCPATDSLRRSLFGVSLSIYNLWARPWGVARLLGLHVLPPCPYSCEGVGQQQKQTKINEALQIKKINSQPNKTTVSRWIFVFAKCILEFIIARTI